jgi:hypothetical protein
MQVYARHPTTEPGSASRRSHLGSKQTTAMVQPDALPWHELVLELDMILKVDFIPTQAWAKDLAPPVYRGDA